MWAFISRLFGVRDHASTALGERAREHALDVLEQHGIAAYYYLPAVGCEDQELAAALRLLAGRGYLLTDARGALVGKVAKARLSSAERADETRKRFFLVEN